MTFHPSNAAFSACWSCAEQVCASPLAACATDCQCDNIIASALACTEDGLSIIECFQAAFDSAGDPAENSAAACLMQQAYLACDCAAVVATDAAAASDSDASTPGGSSSSFGNGECEATSTETSDNIDYIASCSCPEAACVCFGPTTHVVKYEGCPLCPTLSAEVQNVFALCGFPP